MEDLASVEVGQSAVPTAICRLLWWVQIDAVHSQLSDKFTAGQIWVEGAKAVPRFYAVFLHA